MDSPRTGERKKTNPSVSPFRKGRNKNEKFFLILSFLKRGRGDFMKKRKAKR
jgi:hypothetical protein